MSENQIANEQRGEIKGKIGEMDFVLEPTFENVQKAEGFMGKSLIKIASEFQGGNPDLPFGTIAGMINILSKEPKMSVDKIGDLLVDDGVQGAVLMLSTFMKKVLTGGHTPGK